MPHNLPQLAPEIRNIIYEYARLRPEVYSYEYGYPVQTKDNKARSSEIPAQDPTGNLEPSSRKKPARTKDNLAAKSDMPKWFNACPNPPSTALLRTCKRFRLEATAIVYASNTFVFCRVEPAQRFYKRASRRWFNAITDVRLDSFTPMSGPWPQSVWFDLPQIVPIVAAMRGLKNLQLQSGLSEHRLLCVTYLSLMAIDLRCALTNDRNYE